MADYKVKNGGILEVRGLNERFRSEDLDEQTVQRILKYNKNLEQHIVKVGGSIPKAQSKKE